MAKVESQKKKERIIADLMRIEPCDRATAERKYAVMQREASERRFMIKCGDK